jgi:hypothetical protein
MLAHLGPDELGSFGAFSRSDAAEPPRPVGGWGSFGAF